MPTKPVTKSPAQYSKLLQTGFLQEQQNAQSRQRQILLSAAGNWFDALYSIMSDYGLRISEALSIDGRNIDKNGYIFIQGLKGSQNRTILVRQHIDYFTRFAGVKVLVFDGISRFTAYREFKKRNLCHKPKGAKNFAVTHSCRHNVIANLRIIAKTNSNVKHFTGQKSTKSTAGYGQRNETEDSNI